MPDKGPLARAHEAIDDCVLWGSCVDRQGYGRFGRHARAHRAVWEAMNGPIPRGHVLHHKCGIKACVNPAHLELMTKAEHNAHHNKERFSRWTHCKHGHAFDAANTVLDKDGHRACRTCRRLRNAARGSRAAYMRARYHHLKGTPNV
jgi:hypothetical protein